MNTIATRVFRCSIAAYLGVAASAVMAAGPSPVRLVRTIQNPHPQQQANFGWSLDTFNDDLLVGSYGGSVYRLDPETGAELLRLQSPEPFGSFGRSVTQFGNLIAVGANELDIAPHVRVGSAYLFDGTTGAHVRTLRNPDPMTFGWFGFSMESAAGKLFVSSESASGNDRGRVYVYGPDSNAPIASLVNPQAATANAWGFGFGLEEHQGDLFVSAPGAYVAGQERGAIHRYDGDTLARILTINNPHSQADSIFGRSLSTNAAQLLVGAPGRNIGSSMSAGAAYLFDADTGALVRTFLNPEPHEIAQFGESVALVGNFAVIGTPFHWPTVGQGPAYVGAAFVFDVSTGELPAKILTPSPSQHDWFTTGDGRTLLAIGGRLAAGHAFYGDNVGRLYLFALPEPGSAALVSLAACSILLVRRGTSGLSVSSL
jgi:hypothetical protein